MENNIAQCEVYDTRREHCEVYDTRREHCFIQRIIMLVLRNVYSTEFEFYTDRNTPTVNFKKILHLFYNKHDF